MRSNLPFLSAASNATLKPNGSLKWKMRLVKDVRLSLPLTEEMKTPRLTSPLPNVLRLSSPRPRPRLRYGRRLGLLSPKINPKFLYSLFHSVAGSSSSSSSTLNFLNCSSLRKSTSVFADYLRSQFSASQPNAVCVAEPQATFPSSAETTFPEESFCSPFSPAEFLPDASNLSSSTATGPDKVAYSMLKHLPRSGIDFFLHIFNLSWFLHSIPSI